MKNSNKVSIVLISFFEFKNGALVIGLIPVFAFWIISTWFIDNNNILLHFIFSEKYER